MKPKKVSAFVIGVVSIILIAATSSFAVEGGRLMVRRAANFGERVSLSLSVDGKEIARLVQGRSYDGYLKPGTHVISATVVPNLVYSPVWQKQINIRPGQTYSYTAIWQGTKMVLAGN